MAQWREQAPNLDGNVLDDPAWAEVQPVSGFRQSAPDEGQPATERTEVRVVFTDDTVYFGVVCYDRDPSAIIMSDSRRDSSMNDADSFQMVLDTFRDRQNGFVFGTTPAGQEYDGQVTDEGGARRGSGSGGGGGFSRGSGNGFNLNWDGAWQVQTEISDIGWSAEFAIPFRTIRYPDREDQVWGMNFQRNIRRRNETAYWAPLPRQYNLYRVSLAGQLTGVRAPAGFTGNLQVTPYVVGEMATRELEPSLGVQGFGDYGADLKYSVTPGLTLDGTWRTDFAQVEVDQQQINLDRFNLFFPEKRPFFLENAGAFSVANQSSGRNLGQTELFFSRRIGIQDGAQIPIMGGARMSGKVTDSTTVGFLNMQTEQVGTGVNTANNFSVARLRRDLPNRSSIGGLFVNRQGTGSLALGDDYNRTYAFDGRWGIGENGMVQGYMARTETPGRDGRDHAVSVTSQYSSEAWRVGAGYQENGEDFNPEVGYLRRWGGFRKVDFSLYNTTRPDDNVLRYQELTPHMSYTRFWNLDGIMETTYVHLHYNGEFEDSSSAGVAYDIRQEYVFEDFTVSGLTVPAGRWDFQRAHLLVQLEPVGPPERRHPGHHRGVLQRQHRDSPAVDQRALRRDVQPVAELQPERHRPAQRQHRHQPEQHRHRLQLLAAALRPDPPAAQRQRRPLGGELPRRLAAGRQHRVLLRLQRDRRARRLHPLLCRPQRHPEVQLPVRRARLTAPGVQGFDRDRDSLMAKAPPERKPNREGRGLIDRALNRIDTAGSN